MLAEVCNEHILIKKFNEKKFKYHWKKYMYWKNIFQTAITDNQPTFS